MIIAKMFNDDSTFVKVNGQELTAGGIGDTVEEILENIIELGVTKGVHHMNLYEVNFMEDGTSTCIGWVDFLFPEIGLLSPCSFSPYNANTFRTGEPYVFKGNPFKVGIEEIN
jgi:hypothetical protein